MRKKNEELTEEKEKLIRRADEAASFVASHKSIKDEQVIEKPSKVYERHCNLKVCCFRIQSSSRL